MAELHAGEEHYRLELRGRPGWFVPAAGGWFNPALGADEIQNRLWSIMASYHGPLETDESLFLCRCDENALRCPAEQPTHPPEPTREP